MRLLELEIHNVRGILELVLKPDGKNLVIWGPNGSGKSAVVDAIDFLLTGRISRLTGKGTGDIALSKHGPHIDHNLEEATVSAIIQLSDSAAPVEMIRRMANPNNLECENLEDPSLQNVLTLAQRGQYVLTRREILKYITAEAATRAQEIQELLNISEVEEIRKAFVRVRNDLEKDVKAARRNVDTAKAAINATVQEKTYDESKVLEILNKNRAVLGGSVVTVLHSTELKKHLSTPTTASGPQTINLALLERDIKNLSGVTTSTSQALIAKSDQELRDLLKSIRSDDKLMRALSHLELTRQGIELIDDSGACPLCDTPWATGKLREYLEEKLSKAQIAKQHQERISKLSATITNSVNTTIASVRKLIDAAQLVGRNDEASLLRSWLESMEDLSDALASGMDKYPHSGLDAERVKRLLAPVNIDITLSNVRSAAMAKYPSPTPERNAWDSLTRLEENLKALETAENGLKSVGLSHSKAKLLLLSFQEARDDVLEKLYGEIRDRFVGLYRKLHDIDEAKFAAKIKPEGAGLRLEVDFYGRGTHPPHALHSEGHQDSMGLCLYLTLAERLTEGLIDLIILDDVVMSVDTGHRKELCKLLASSFPEKQFLITTHDRTWANQLKSEGIVDTKGTVEFFNWNIDSGPYVICGKDIWDRIDNDLKKGDIPSAAARLRRGLEEFLGMVCDALQVPVEFKLTGQWDLGDLLLPAMNTYKELLKKAKRSAKSWENSEDEIKFTEMDGIRSGIYKRTHAEHWAVNANVHYNNWANFTERDFRPVAEAFQDLCALFLCSKCGAMLHLASEGFNPVSVRCNCGKENWNLLEKKA